MPAGVTIRFSLVAALTLLSAVSPAAAQNNTPAEPLPGLDAFDLPSSRPTPRLAPAPEPTIRPLASATPPPLAAPTPSASPVARATPTPRPSSTPRAAATPGLATDAASPVATAPLAPPSDEPSPASTPPVSTVTAAAPTSAGPGYTTLLLAIGASLLAGAAIGVSIARRRPRGSETGQGGEAPSGAGERADAGHEVFVLTEDAAHPAAPMPNAPPPAATLQTTSIPAPGAVAVAPSMARAMLELELIPHRAGTDAAGLLVEYLIVLRNTGTAAASAVRLDVRLFGAGPRQDALIAALFGTAVARPITPPFDLAPGATIELGGAATHPRDTLEVMPAGGRTVAVPVLTVNAQYDWPGGSGQTARSYVIGIARGAEARLQPFAVDGPPRLHGNVSALDYTVSVER